MTPASFVPSTFRAGVAMRRSLLHSPAPTHNSRGRPAGTAAHHHALGSAAGPGPALLAARAARVAGHHNIRLPALLFAAVRLDRLLHDLLHGLDLVGGSSLRHAVGVDTQVLAPVPAAGVRRRVVRQILLAAAAALLHPHRPGLRRLPPAALLVLDHGLLA